MVVLVDEHVRAIFGGDPPANRSVRLVELRPKGLGLKARFSRQGHDEVELLLQPPGKALRFCARLKAFDVVVLGELHGWEEPSRPSLVRDIVEILEGADTPTTLQDWIATVGPEADARFVVGGVAEIKLTARCDQRCVFCKSPRNLANQVHGEDVDRLLVRLARKARFLTLSGGETLLSDRVEEYVRKARQGGFEEVEIQTNGMRLAEPGRVRRLMDAGVTNVLVSLHAHTDALSDRLTGTPGGFRRTLRGIERCLAEGLPVCLCHVICEGNFRVLPTYARFVRERFGGYPITVLFTLAIPTYRVRDDPGLMPRLSHAGPLLRRALGCFESAAELEAVRRAEADGRVQGSALTDGIHGIAGRVKAGLLRPRGGSAKGPAHTARVIRHCGMPPCVLGEQAYYHDDLVFPTEVPAGEEMVHPPRCSTCAYRSRCIGLWQTYVDRFGADGISAVRPPLPSRVERLLSLAPAVSEGLGPRPSPR